MNQEKTQLGGTPPYQPPAPQSEQPRAPYTPQRAELPVMGVRTAGFFTKEALRQQGVSFDRNASLDQQPAQNFGPDGNLPPPPRPRAIPVTRENPQVVALPTRETPQVTALPVGEFHAYQPNAPQDSLNNVVSMRSPFAPGGPLSPTSRDTVIGATPFKREQFETPVMTETRARIAEAEETMTVLRTEFDTILRNAGQNPETRDIEQLATVIGPKGIGLMDKAGLTLEAKLRKVAAKYYGPHATWLEQQAALRRLQTP